MRRTFNKDLLNKLIQEKSATLLETYDTLNIDSIIKIKCLCGTEFEKRFHTLVYKGGGASCFDCSKKRGRERAKQKCLELYGAESVFQNKDIQQKIKATNLEKYGGNPAQCEAIREKIKATNLEKYGVSMALQNPAIKQKATESLIEHYGAEPFKNPLIRDKIKATSLERYGVENAMQNKDTTDKVKATNLEKYGGHPLQNEVVMTKLKKTNLEKYGAENPLQNPEIKQKALDTIVAKYGTTNVMESEEVKAKIRATNNEKYGHDYATQSAIVREKTEATSLQKYGVKCNLMLESNKDQVKATNKEKYGVEYSLQSEVVKAKSKATCIKKYGVEYPSQNPEQFAKKNAYKRKPYIFPSGVRMVQGSEPLALDILLQTYTEDQLVTEVTKVPRIIYTIDGKDHYYFPDIYIPHENKIIEVKSTWTYACKTDNIQQKADATKALGYTYEIWIFDKKQRVAIV